MDKKINEIPISKNLYTQMTNDHWKGTTAITLQPIKSGSFQIPIGTKCKITKKFRGFSIQTESCTCCGVSAHVNRVPYYYLSVYSIISA